MASKARSERSPLAELTTRELEVLAAIAEGKSNSAISDALFLTKRAVEKHINAIFLKLNLSHAENAGDVSPRVKAALVFLAESDSPGRAPLSIGRRAPLRPPAAAPRVALGEWVSRCSRSMTRRRSAVWHAT